MTKKSSLHLTIAILAGLGLLLSGYLSYMNLWGPSCSEGFLNRYVSCGGPKKVLIIGQPTCVYGFGMYVLVTITNIWAWRSKRPARLWTGLLVLGIAGTLFSGGLTVYELFILKLQFTTLPACVYGLILYLGILLSAWRGRRTVSALTSP